MDDQYNNFHNRQLLGHGCIEDDGKCYHSNDEERTMPGSRYIATVVQSDKALDLRKITESASYKLYNSRLSAFLAGRLFYIA